MPRLTIEQLKKAFSYDPETGFITRLVTSFTKTVQVGDVVGTPDKNGYLQVSFLLDKFQSHRLAWALHHGEWPPQQIDHINGIKYDNRLENLRLANNSQNMANRKASGVSGIKGVKKERSGKWSAIIRSNNKQTYLGNFLTSDEAAHTYNKAAIAAHGEFAVLNPIGVDYD